MYRILVDSPTDVMAAKLDRLLADELSREVTEAALEYLDGLFASGPGAVGAMMAGRAEEGVGNPDFVSQSVSFLASDLVRAVGEPK